MTKRNCNVTFNISFLGAAEDDLPGFDCLMSSMRTCYMYMIYIYFLFDDFDVNSKFCRLLRQTIFFLKIYVSVSLSRFIFNSTK